MDGVVYNISIAKAWDKNISICLSPKMRHYYIYIYVVVSTCTVFTLNIWTDMPEKQCITKLDCFTVSYSANAIIFRIISG